MSKLIKTALLLSTIFSSSTLLAETTKEEDMKIAKENYVKESEEIVSNANSSRRAAAKMHHEKRKARAQTQENITTLESHALSQDDKEITKKQQEELYAVGSAKDDRAVNKKMEIREQHK